MARLPVSASRRRAAPGSSSMLTVVWDTPLASSQRSSRRQSGHQVALKHLEVKGSELVGRVHGPVSARKDGGSLSFWDL